MKKLLTLIAVCALTTTLFSFNAVDTPNLVMTKVVKTGDWEKLGSRMVNMRADHDEILVTAQEGFFTKVKFVVRKAPIHVKNVKIVFGNGESKVIEVNRKFAAGTESKVIDLPGNKRIIRKVVMNYKTVPAGKGRALVVLWGKH